MWDYGIAIDYIMCDDLHLVNVVGMDDITCDDLTYDDLNPKSVRLWDWDWWYNVWWYNVWWSNICLPKSRCVWECGIGIDDIMCVDVTCDYLHLASMTGIDDITCDDLTYDELNPDVCEIVVLGWMI